jgi:hypothetical protein
MHSIHPTDNTATFTSEVAALDTYALCALTLAVARTKGQVLDTLCSTASLLRS